MWAGEINTKKLKVVPSLVMLLVNISPLGMLWSLWYMYLNVPLMRDYSLSLVPGHALTETSRGHCSSCWLVCCFIVWIEQVCTLWFGQEKRGQQQQMKFLWLIFNDSDGSTCSGLYRKKTKTKLFDLSSKSIPFPLYKNICKGTGLARY